MSPGGVALVASAEAEGVLGSEFDGLLGVEGRSLVGVTSLFGALSADPVELAASSSSGASRDDGCLFAVARLKAILTLV
jgi:hypothetical protein